MPLLQSCVESRCVHLHEAINPKPNLQKFCGMWMHLVDSRIDVVNSYVRSLGQDFDFLDPNW